MSKTTPSVINNIRQYISIKGARVHNLKNIDISLPRNKLVVVTGVSGSGKSSLTIDTLYAEGQRRYVESLSSYARQFLMRMNKPDVDYIKGISPAIAIEQKVITRSSRSTVGTLTEIYDYLRLLYARLGVTYSPISGQPVKRHSVSDVVDYVFAQPEKTKVQILIPFVLKDSQDMADQLSLFLQKGYARLNVQGKFMRIEDAQQSVKALPDTGVFVVIDRLSIKHNKDTRNRCADSVNTAFFESMGDCVIDITGLGQKHFNNRFELDGLTFEEPNAHFFNFNNPYGACKVCEGFGTVVGIDENLVIPNKGLSLYNKAIAPWRGDKMSAWSKQFIQVSHKFDFPVHKPIGELTPKEYNLLWTGNEHVQGLDDFFAYLKSKSHKIQYRVMLAKYRGRTTCRDCMGSRLRKDAQYVKIGGAPITKLVNMPIKQLMAFFQQLELSPYQQTVAKRILLEINNRLQVMNNIGLGYLTLNRLSSTLSGGETQRINLTRSLGSNLTNSMYILDEPSIGLHPRDTKRLIEVLQQLRDLGNTVIVVEHEEDIIRAADHIVDIGPLAGRLGGEVVYNGPASTIESANTLTADYLTGRKMVEIPTVRRPVFQKIVIEKASQFNLKNITVTFPLNAITVVTGVSGSGKTTLVKNILYPALRRHLENTGDAPGQHEALLGNLSEIKKIELINQNPLGRSSRSNPITYIKAYNAIRDLFAKQQLSKIRGFKPKHFSFNVEGGRCEECKGEGFTTIEMQFLANVRLQCESCEGKRFKPEVIAVQYKEKSINDILNMSVNEAIAFFEGLPDVAAKIQPLSDVGLGYVKLGQSSSTLSGGEAQRVKLASYLGKGKNSQSVLFIFDEPSTGLHFNDINKLMKAFNALVENGHTVIIVEHNMDIIKCADWLIDLGPNGGSEGGELLYEGQPEGLLACTRSHTATFLREKLLAE